MSHPLATPSAVDQDEIWMALALEMAQQAATVGEAPVGALIVDQTRQIVVAQAHNCPVAGHDPTAHAEIMAIRAAAQALSNYRLAPDLTLYVTLEPCAMCAGAISHARLARLVYGAADPKGGAVAHGARYFEQPTCHWRPSITGGVLGEPCGQLLRDFFRARRRKPVPGKRRD